MRTTFKLTLLFAVFLTVAVLENPADAQTFGSAPGCDYTYEPPGGPWTNYSTDESYAWVDLYRADGSVDRIQPAPAGTTLPGTAVRMVKCYGPTTTPTPEVTPEPTPTVPVPTPTPEDEPDPTPTPEVPTPEPTPTVPATPSPEPPPAVEVEVLRCNDTDRPNSEAYATAEGPGWATLDGVVLEPGVRTLVAWNSYANLIHFPTGETISIEALGFDTCVPQTTVPEPEPEPEPVCHEDEPCWDCETMGNGICGPEPTPDEGSPVSPNPDTPEATPNGDTITDTSSVPPTAAEPVPGEDVLAYTDSTVTNAILSVGLVFLALGVGLLVGPPIGRRIGEWLGRR